VIEHFDSAALIGPLIDVVIALTVIECVVLVAWHHATGRGVAPRDFIVNLLSGLCLMLALRALAHQAGAGWVAFFLFAAGVAHGLDIWRRWQRRNRAAPAREGVTA
jgi:hypothetical protein